MEEKYCYLHKEVKAHSFCKQCGKSLCNACARFHFGNIFCDSCMGSEAHKNKNFSSDPIKYERRTVKQKDYSNLYIKYAFRIFILIVLIIIVINRGPILAYAQKIVPPNTGVSIISGITGAINAVIPETNKEGVKKLTSKIAGTLIQIQMSQFAGQIEYNYMIDKSYPPDFPDFLKKNFSSNDKSKDVSKDIWDTPYKLEIKDDGFEIISAGIDRSFGTEDDIIYIYKRKKEIPM